MNLWKLQRSEQLLNAELDGLYQALEHSSDESARACIQTRINELRHLLNSLDEVLLLFR